MSDLARRVEAKLDEWEARPGTSGIEGLLVAHRKVCARELRALLAEAREEAEPCPYCDPDGTIRNGDNAKVCPYCKGSHIAPPASAGTGSLTASATQPPIDFVPDLAGWDKGQ